MKTDRHGIPYYYSLMLPVLRASATGERKIGDVVNELADQLNLSEDARSRLLPSGKQTTFANRTHWAKTYLGKARLVTSTRRGHFQITDRGREVLASSPPAIDPSYLQRFPEFRSFRDGAIEDDLSDIPALEQVVQDDTPDEILRAAQKRIEDSLAAELIDRIRGASPAFFERLVVDLLLSMGYGGSVEDAGSVLGRSGDDGVDGVIDQDALGLDRVYVQAKRYAADNTVGAGAIRDFFGSLDRHKASKGLFVTTSSFSKSAVETASFLSKRIALVDGVTLARLMIRHDVGCQTQEVIKIKRIDEDFFDAS